MFDCVLNVHLAFPKTNHLPFSVVIWCNVISNGNVGIKIIAVTEKLSHRNYLKLSIMNAERKRFLDVLQLFR